MRNIAIFLLCSYLLVGCSQQRQTNAPIAQISPIQKGNIMPTIPSDIFLLDVRTLEEHKKAYIPKTDAVIPYETLQANSDKLPGDKGLPIVVYCQSGGRSATAMKTLKSMGYTNVSQIEGGINAWQQKGGVIVTMN